MNIEREIGNWNELTELATEFAAFNPMEPLFWFRGHSDANWSLKPTIGRLLRSSFSLSGAYDRESQALDEFRSQAHHYLAPNAYSATKDIVDWWAIMQHHGAPTRLLDWTTSCYVAAYFAAQPGGSSEGAIWIIDIGQIENAFQEQYPSAAFPGYPASAEEVNKYFNDSHPPPVVHFFSQPVKSERMIAQQGVFSVSPDILADHGELIVNISKDHGIDKAIIKARIRNSLKIDLRRNLHAMNIRAGALFPGIDGVGRSIHEFLELGNWR